MGQHHRDEGGSEGEIDDPAGQAVGKLLDGRARALGRLHGGHDLTKSRVQPHALGPDIECPQVVGRACENRRAGAFVDGYGFPCDARLIHGGFPGDNDAVDRNLGAGPDHYYIAGLHFRDRRLGKFGPASNNCCPRQQRGEVDQRLPAPAHRHLFQNLRAEHEEEDERSGGELADRQSRNQRHGHGEFHGHAADEQVFHRLPEHAPATAHDRRDGHDVDAADARDHPQPTYRRRHSHQGKDDRVRTNRFVRAMRCRFPLGEGRLRHRIVFDCAHHPSG